MAVEALQLTTDLAQVVGDDLAPNATGPADPRDAAKFNELLDGPARTSADEPGAVEAASRAGQPGHSMGDHILSSLQNVSTDMQGTWKALGDSLKGDMSATKLLQVQMGLAHMVLQYELVSKAVTRSTQNIDQLVKLQ